MSEIKVNKVSPRTGTDVTLGDSGDTFTIPNGATLTTTSATVNLPATTTVTTELKTNKISPASGTAFTLGDSGDTFTIPAGATITNSGTATGFGSSDFVLLSSSDISSSTALVEFDGLFSSTYKNYKVIISGLLPVDNGVRLNAQMKESGSYVTSGAYTYLIGADIVYNTTDGSTTNLEKATNGTKVVMTSEMKNSSGETNSLEINIYDPLGSHYKAMTWHNQNYGNALTNLFRNYVGASVLRASTNDCTAIKFFMDSGNIAKGNFKLYGIK
tara:strand:+ start:195 stop:1010 length:816 start_codon:yes stop_codon:yes gene_type:complete